MTTLSNPPQVVALEVMNALTTVTAMSVLMTGVTSGLLASGIFAAPKPVKKREGISLRRQT